MDTLRALRLAGAVEALSLAVLLVNLVTVHAQPITGLGGPVHGLAYLSAIALTWTGPCSRAARCWVVVPGIGALIAARTLRWSRDRI